MVEESGMTGGHIMLIVYSLVTSAIFLMGVVHIALTPKFYKKLSPATLWYVSGGITLILVSFLNFILITVSNNELIAKLICHISNFASIVFLALLLKVLREPQVVLLLCLTILETALAIFLFHA